MKRTTQLTLIASAIATLTFGFMASTAVANDYKIGGDHISANVYEIKVKGIEIGKGLLLGQHINRSFNVAHLNKQNKFAVFGAAKGDVTVLLPQNKSFAGQTVSCSVPVTGGTSTCSTNGHKIKMRMHHNVLTLTKA